MPNIINLLFKLEIFFLLCQGAGAWFTWFVSELDTTTKTIVNLLFSVIAYLYAYCHNIKLKLKRHELFAFICFAVAFIYNNGVFGITTIPSFVIMFFPFYIVYKDYSNIEETVSVLIKVLAAIVVLGLLIHIFILLGGELPSQIIERPGNNKAYTFYNYILLLKGASYYESDGLRFQSIFLEPGYCGSLFAFLLYVVKYNMKKKENLAIFIGLLFTLSVAGYITTIVGYLYYNFLVSKERSLRYFVILAIIVCCLSYFVDKRNVIYTKFLYRFELDEKKGLKGNNRYGDETLFYFDKFSSSGIVLWGIGNENVQKINGNDWSADENIGIRGAGYKVYFIKYGIISAFLMFLFYWIIGCVEVVGKSRLYIGGFFLLVILTFVQAAYPWSWAWLIPYALGINIGKFSLNKYKRANL